MKKLTLDQTWTEQLKLSRWIVSARSKKQFAGRDIPWLKRYYFRHVRRIKRYLRNNCYFCQYNQQEDGRFLEPDQGTCSHCPGSIVQYRFHCGRVSYDYFSCPEKFLRKIEALNRKRKKH